MSQIPGSAAASLTEEPGTGKPHAGICAGGVGELASLPRRHEFHRSGKEVRQQQWSLAK